MNDKQFTDVIKKLELLQSVQPDEDFKLRMEKKVISYSTSNRFAMPLFSLRIAMIIFTLLMTGTTIIGVAQKSQPGDALYPIKKVVDSIKINFNPEKELAISPTPVAKTPTPTPTSQPVLPSPTPTTATQKQLMPTEPNKQNPTALPTFAPTVTPVTQGIVPAVKGTVDTVIDTLPVKLPIGGASQPTPTPQSQNVGSKDNGSNAGAGGSLLPKIKIEL